MSIKTGEGWKFTADPSPNCSFLWSPHAQSLLFVIARE